MISCPACSKPVDPGHATCPSCGSDLPGALDATRVTGGSGFDATRVSHDRTQLSSSAPPSSGERFAPGTVIRDRYRIIALLGRGGMGEVYRADDLKLGHSVALKFLPPGLEQDPVRLERFLAEVRTARQVTHQHVCRVHDLDEFGGQHFLSMEYVDGEDLASTLRRFGRLPEERAVEVARQICAGLAAAHDAGVLHRDLKPANVMLDGRGQVKLTDFGLASLADELTEEDVRAGTPAYMAPEQLSGTEFTRASDIYALGLVLYELFTGRPVYQATTVAELSSLHASGMPSRPTDVIGTLDPVIETVVMRCLEKDPARRPMSAIAVAAGLPGGDPLAAALAAGETPSPELVAESGEREGMRPIVAFGMALLGLGLCVGGAFWAASMSWINFLPFEKQPEVLEDRALGLIAELGYTEEAYTDPVDSAWGWLIWNDVLRSVAESGSTATRWEGLRERADAGGYWYRQSTNRIVPVPTTDAVMVHGQVTLTNPTPTTAGDVMVLFDLDGSLRRFEVMPRRFSMEEPSEPDWSILFAAAELDTARFEPVRPRYQRFMSPDLRRAWVGTIADQPDIEYRVEAGAFEGRPVLFNVAPNASLDDLGEPPAPNRPTLFQNVMNQGQTIVILLVVFLVAQLSGRNLNLRRTDTRGAMRIGFAMLTLHLVIHSLVSHTLAGPDFANAFWHLLVASTFIGMISWGMYSAVEPVVRQVWPTMFVSSSRLLSRPRPAWRDPLLGRSVLIGLIVGGAWYCLENPGLRTIRTLIENPTPWPFGVNIDMLQGPTVALAEIFPYPIQFAFAFLQISSLVLIQRAVNRRWLAVALAIAVWVFLDGFGSTFGFFIALANAVVTMTVLLRWGFVAMLMLAITENLIWDARMAEVGHWTSEGAHIALAGLVVLTLYGFWAATGRGDTAR